MAAEGVGPGLKAGGLPTLQAEGLDQPVALNILDQEAVEIPRRLAHPRPVFLGGPRVKPAHHQQHRQRQKNKPSKERIRKEEHHRDTEDRDHRPPTHLRAIQQGPLHGSHVFDHPGGDLPTLALVVEGDRQVQQFAVQVPPHIHEHPLL